MSYHILTKSGAHITFNEKAASFDSDVTSFNNDGLISFFDEHDELVAAMPASSIACIFRNDTGYYADIAKSLAMQTPVAPLDVLSDSKDGKRVKTPTPSDVPACFWNEPLPLSQEVRTNAESFCPGDHTCKCT